jgi:apolipoprotein N-acyltransferase
MPPALLSRDRFPVSAVICYDANINDLVRPLARAGGLLAIPSNDWKEIEQLHSPSAVWVPVMTAVPLIRSTGHRRSVVFDAAGRLWRWPAASTGRSRWSRHAHLRAAPRSRDGNWIGQSTCRG